MPDPAQLALVCVVALAAATLGGLSGFGTGLVLPVFLVPLVGVTRVIPVMAVAMLLANGSRVLAFRRDVQGPHVRRLLLLGLPACLAAAWGYTLLPARAIGLLLGGFLLASVPLRRWLRRRAWQLSPRAELAAGGAFGFVDGGLTGTGVILISILMAAGVAGPALVATDALVSVALGLAKVLLFGRLAALDLQGALVGLLVGLCTMPGAFIARALLRRLPAGFHAGFMEGVVLVGAVLLLVQAWR